MRRPICLLAFASVLLGCGGGSPAKRSTTQLGGTNGGCRSVTPAVPKTVHLARPTLRLNASRRYTLRLQTSCGDVAISLDVRHSPRTTASFAYLTQQHFFDGLSFHRVARGPDGSPFVIQGGDPRGDGSGGPGYQVVEPPPRSTRYTEGVVAMAKTQTDPPGASGSQFFIVAGPDAGLPPDYAVLGRLRAGADVVARIAAVQTNASEQPLSPVIIEHATVG